MKDFEVVEYANGIRLVHRNNPYTKIAHLGIMLDIGSRDEADCEQGIAHFWEHMAFKGTKKRKAFHILNRLESLGGELNAYTTKEKICFYSAILSSHLDRAVDLLTDITFNSVFPPRQIEKERQVILEEMSLYQDSPEDAIQDDLDELMFAGHSIGKNILGTPETVAKIQQDDFVKFVDKNLDTSKIVISSIGNYSLNKVDRIVRKYINEIERKQKEQVRSSFEGLNHFSKEVKKPFSQVHFGLSSYAYPLTHPDRLSFFMLCNILGGPAMNSRLNLSLREKHGLVYGVDAQYTPYTDAGQFSIFFATDPKNFKRSKSLIFKEMKILKSKKMGQMQLNTARQQLKGQLAMSEENYNSVMLMMAKSLLDLERIPDLDVLFKKIDEITADDLLRVANESWDFDSMSSLAFIPEN